MERKSRKKKEQEEVEKGGKTCEEHSKAVGVVKVAKKETRKKKVQGVEQEGKTCEEHGRPSSGGSGAEGAKEKQA